MPTYLAFDLGASSGRAILGHFDGHKMEIETLYRFPTPLQEQGPRLYWDVETLWTNLQTGLQRALQQAPDLRSLSIDSWGVDYVPLDKDGHALRPPYCYRDPRTAGVMEKTLAQVGRQALYTATGIQFMPINTLYQVLTDQAQEPALFAQTANRLPLADYFHYRFSGQLAAEQSLASTTQLLSIHTGGWSEEVMAQVGLPLHGWPALVPTATLLGPCKQAPHVQVVAGCTHDTACAVAAVPAEKETNWAYLSCGTWSLLGIESEQPILTKAAQRASFTNERGPFARIRFLKNLNGFWVLEECLRHWYPADHAPREALLEEAAQGPPAGFTLDLNAPALALRGDMPAKLQSAVAALGQRPPSQHSGWVRLILESLAASYSQTLDTLASLTQRRFDVLHIVGGGARNAALCQWTADACQIPVLAGPAEATALGNLLLQAYALGDLPPDCTIRQVVRQSTTVKTYLPA